MPIKGLTDNQSRVDRRSNYWGGALHKGTRKQQKRFGTDLENNFRFEPFSETAQKALLDAYPKDASVDSNGDVIIPKLDVFLAYSEIEKTFETWMRKWNVSGLERQCDRSTIVLESQTITDRYGQPRTKAFPCNKPCPMIDDPIGVDCEYGCMQEGTLVFYLYLPEQMIKGLYVPHPCYLTVKGYTDVTGLDDTLWKIQDTYGSIKQSPMPAGTFGNIIPMILTRQKVAIKRPLTGEEKIEVAGQKKAKLTGKKADDYTWAVSLQINPKWIAACEAARQIQVAIGMGYRPSVTLLQKSQIDIALPGTIDVKALPQSEFASKEEAIAIWQLAEANGWTKDGMRHCLQSAYGIDSFARIPFEKKEEIAQLAASPDSAKKWCYPPTEAIEF